MAEASDSGRAAGQVTAARQREGRREGRAAELGRRRRSSSGAGEMAASAEAASPPRVAEIARNGVLKGAEPEVNQSKKQRVSV